MAELITFLIALPALYLFGEFYWRMGRRVWRTLKPAAPVRALAMEAEPMPDSRYDLAVAAASAIIHELEARPEISPAEKLSTLTFTILRAMHQAEEQPRGWLCSEPSVN